MPEICETGVGTRPVQILAVNASASIAAVKLLEKVGRQRPAASIRRVSSGDVRAILSHLQSADRQFGGLRKPTPGPSNVSGEHICLLCVGRGFFDSSAIRSVVAAAMAAERKGALILLPVIVECGVNLDDTPLAGRQLANLMGSDDIANTVEQLDVSVKRSFRRGAGVTTQPPADEPLQVAVVAERRVEKPAQLAEAIDLVPSHMSEYDDFVEQLIGKMQLLHRNRQLRHLALFSESLRQVLAAEMVYCYLRTGDGQLHIWEAGSNQPVLGQNAREVHQQIEKTLDKHASGEQFKSLQLRNFLPHLVASDQHAYDCTVVVNQNNNHCGVFVASRQDGEGFRRSEVISTVVNTLHDYLVSSRFENFEKLKARVYDSLRTSYKFVSPDMYRDRLRIFVDQLDKLCVHFEPIFKFDRRSRDVKIFAYEALARENSQSDRAPAEIFDAAALWGAEFQAVLDKRLLVLTLASYEAQVAPIAAEEIKPLTINVYPASLNRVEYRELLYAKLQESAVLSGEHIVLEVSEKTVVSPESQAEQRKDLKKYRQLLQKIGEHCGVRYAIDDFGVGNASLSRLDNLRPDFVKIDRDILSFEKRMAARLIRCLLDSEGDIGTTVILEGVDIHSSFSLSELVGQFGVHLVQGYCLSRALPQISLAKEAELCEKAMREVGWSKEAEFDQPVLA